MTQEQIVIELKKLTKQRALLASQQKILKQQLATYAKYRMGDRVTTPYDSDIWEVIAITTTSFGRFTYTLKNIKGPPFYSRPFRESVLSPA
jgi:hypothetical protein